MHGLYKIVHVYVILAIVMPYQITPGLGQGYIEFVMFLLPINTPAEEYRPPARKCQWKDLLKLSKVLIDLLIAWFVLYRSKWRRNGKWRLWKYRRIFSPKESSSLRHRSSKYGRTFEGFEWLQSLLSRHCTFQWKQPKRCCNGEKYVTLFHRFVL